nr:MAG TPA: hypothetical protein [Caudoviricetes sp.]
MKRQSKTASQNWPETTNNLLRFHYRQQPPDNPSAVFFLLNSEKLCDFSEGVSSNLTGVLFE